MAQFRKAAISCIFCDNRADSEEHLFPKWTGPLLDQGHKKHSPNRMEFVSLGEKLVIIQPPKFKINSGAVQTTTIKHICSSCNNTWMSQIEEAAKPVFSTMIRGEDTVVSPDEQIRLRNWALLKAMVGEFDHPESACITTAERLSFKRDRALPKNCQILMGRTKSERWRLRYHHAPTKVYAPIMRLFDPELLPPNTQTTIISIQGTFFCLSSSTLTGLTFPDVDGSKLVQIYPSTGTDFAWPLGFSDEKTVDDLSFRTWAFK